MSAGFTPGPWAANDTCSQADRWMVLAPRPDPNAHGYGVARGIEDKADANLIAAAPDLYEALYEMFGEDLGGDQNPDNSRRETDYYRPVVSWAMRHRARTALVKARGQ